jgi:Protein of unknown function (DUF3105)
VPEGAGGRLPLSRGEALAKDRTPDARRGSSAAGRPGGKGRTRPPTQVVTQQRRPWGLIAGAVAVLLFAVAAIGFAVAEVNEADANAIESPDEIQGLDSYYEDYEEPQEHVATTVEYEQSPPVGGPHAAPPDWADCTGTVYDAEIRPENAVHGLEHGAVWITYNPDDVSEEDIDELASYVDGVPYRMMSPYEGQDSPISLQSWGHQLKLDSATDPRIEQFADFFTQNAEFTPEPGASCENPAFVASPLPPDAAGDAPADESAAPESTEPSETPAQ